MTLIPRPIYYEDAREAIAMEGFLDNLARMTELAVQRKNQEIQETHDKWSTNWRTRLVVKLREWAMKIELPEPERPEGTTS